MIDDEPTLELDYKSLHPRLLYNMDGLEAPEDCYALNGFDRDLVKSASLIAFNSDSFEQAVRALIKDAQITSEEAKAVLNAYQEANQPIANYLFKGSWKRLQNLDSHLVDLVLGAATLKGVPVLPVHDSFIVNTRYSSWLRTQIQKAYKELTSFDAPVDWEDMDELEIELFT